MKRAIVLSFTSAALWALTACSQKPEANSTLATTTTPSSAPPSKAYFVDVTETAALDFRHRHGGSGRKYLPEIMGAGGCALDFDGDLRLDLFLVQSGALPGSDGVAAAQYGHHQLWRNLGQGRFSNTADPGVAVAGYGMGAVCADYDNDGDTDIFVTSLGADRLLQNDGGRFHDVTEAAGIDSPLWGSSALFFDADRDGWLDLYVVNYLDFTLDKHVDCGTPSRGILSYCHPDVYDAAADVFFHNRGDGTFEEATEAFGLKETTGKGLGVVAGDFDHDGWTDLYVANDSTPNFLFHNLGNGTFEEVGLFWGVSHNEDGKTEAGMGTDSGDVDGDGRLDLFATNLSHEANALYLGGEALFRYHSRRAGLVEPSLVLVGFGIDLADLDNDGDLDLLVTNGHVIDNIELTDDSQHFEQPTQLFLGDGTGSFEVVEGERLGELALPRVGRGTITLDFDDDGRLDFVLTTNNDRTHLFQNQAEAKEWIGFLLAASEGNRDGIGARVVVEAAGKTQLRERRCGSSYQTSSDPRLHFGLGDSNGVDGVTVEWPSGTVQSFGALTAGRYYRLEEGTPAAEPLD